MGSFLIDSNIISGFLSSLYSDKALEFLSDVFNKTPNISVITEIDALSWTCAAKDKEAIIKSFVSDANVLSLSADVVKQCVRIRRSRKIKTPDAIIAATAITHNYTLITSDKGFRTFRVYEPLIRIAYKISD